MDDSDLIRKAMSALAKRRWAGMSADERREAMAVLQAKRKPGSRVFTPEQRAAAGKRLAAGRAAKRKPD